MIIEMQLSITPQYLQLTIPQANHSQRTPNIIAISPKRKRIFGFGLSKEAVRQRLGERWDEIKDDLIFKHAFNQVEPDLELEKYVLWRSITNAHRQVREGRGLQRMFHQAVDRFDVRLDIEGYERFALERRQALEYFLQSDLRARKLVINSRPVEISPRLRTTEAWVRVLFTLTIPYLLIGAGVFIVIGLPESSLPGEIRCWHWQRSSD
jgi:hypothetical protein